MDTAAHRSSAAGKLATYALVALFATTGVCIAQAQSSGSPIPGPTDQTERLTSGRHAGPGGGRRNTPGDDSPGKPVPEPGTMALASMGLLALGAAIRKRTNH